MSINKKNKLYKQYLQHRSNEKLLKYKTYKNKLTDLLRVAKRFYFQNQIELNKTNIKQTWRILNNAIGQNEKKKLAYSLQGRIQGGGWIGWISTPHFSVKKNSKCHFI